MKLIDTKHAFYQPRWRRIAITAFVGGWFAFEALVSHNGMFMAISGGLLAYTVWTLIIGWKPGSQP